MPKPTDPDPLAGETFKRGSHGLWLNLNDTFDYATADAMLLPWEDVPRIETAVCTYGLAALNAYAAVVRGRDVLEELQTPEYWKAKAYLAELDAEEELGD